MMTRNDMFRLAVVMAGISALSLAQNRLNKKREQRARQFLMPFIAVLYSAAASAILIDRYEWGEIICRITKLLTNAQIVAMNVLLMSVFLAIKAVTCPLSAWLWKNKRLMDMTSAYFYEYDEEYEEWFLKRRWEVFREIIVVSQILCMVLVAGILEFSWRRGLGSSYICFPCAALIVINEVLGFINGMSKEEFLHNITGDEADSRRAGNYSHIREIYEGLFAGKVLASHTGCEFSEKKSAAGFLKEMECSKDAVERSAAHFFLTYEGYKELDVDLIQAATNLVHGKSMIVFNPFYRDLGIYFILPIMEILLKGKKCLFIAGRSSIAEDVACWLSALMDGYSHVGSLWKVGELGMRATECDIGILRFQQIYDVDILSANKGFFGNVGLVIMVEPSVMLGMGQVGLGIIAEEMSRYGESPVYCICDRHVDGLLDTMSHILRTEIIDAASVSVPRCIYTGMSWNADGDFIRQELFDRQTRFLGNGIELAAVAVKNQIPHVIWYGEKKVPLKDIKWIAGQYFSTICRYMNLPAYQESIYEKISFIPNLWCGNAGKEQFLIVEDEFCNMFSMMRVFLSRGGRQIFVNILSENYLLRDYMRCNQQMFLSNANAIPSLASDYAKTERNMVLKLIMMMAVRQVSEQEAAEELCMAGCGGKDTFGTISRLLKKYTSVDASVLKVTSVKDESGLMPAGRTIFYSIPKETFAEHFARTLQTAYYIVEEEKRQEAFIDAKMFGHVVQTVLPGQFVIYNGKYYQVKMVSSVNGVILRRASDLYTGRKYYRQLRSYHFEKSTDDAVVSIRRIADLEVSVLQRDFMAAVSGYLEMDDNCNLRKAKVVSFEGDPTTDDYTRIYHNKHVLQIRLPETDDKIRFTLCLLLSEIFRSVFPDTWQYLAVLAVRPDDIDGVLNHAVYTLSGDVSDDCIYVVEDSSLDLGLLDAVLRNLRQLFELMADFLDWHFEKMREPERKDPTPSGMKKPEEMKRRTLFLRMADRIRKLFGGKEEKVSIRSVEEVEHAAEMEEGAVDTVQHAEPEVYAESSDGIKEIANAVAEEAIAEEEVPEDAEIAYVDGTDIFEEESSVQDDEWIEESLVLAGVEPITKTRYQEECYLKFGYGEIDSRLKIEEAFRYLHFRGYCNNALAKARRWDGKDTHKHELDSVNCCSFCGLPMNGVSFERLSDGRVRCNDCSASAVTTVEELKNIFYDVLQMMEIYFGTVFHVRLNVKMTDARTVAKGSGSVYTPSEQQSDRVIGYAEKKRETYNILIENGSPRLAMVCTMVHELVHIWQYCNWPSKEMEDNFSMKNKFCADKARDIVYEGMAVWASIQYLYQIGETSYARKLEDMEKTRKDVYGIGFRLYDERYPLVKDFSLMKYTPFLNFPPLEPEDVKCAVRGQCEREDCMC